MTLQILRHHNHNQNEIQNARVQNLASAPSGPVPGQIYYDTTLASVMQWNGVAWRPLDAAKLADASIQIAGLAVNPLARANHTGTQTASTISDLATVVKAYHLNEFAAPQADVSLANFKIINLGTAVNPNDAISLTQAQSLMQSTAAGISSKDPVNAVATTNITLSGTQTIDGSSLTAGSRVLVTGQTTTAQNGVYNVASGAWTRSTLEGATAELDPGATWLVLGGTTYGGTQWRMATTGAITVGTTPISIVQFSASQAITAGNGLSQSGSQFNVNPTSGGGIIADGAGTRVDTTLIARKFSQTLATSATSYLVTHSLNTLDIMGSVRNISTGDIQDADINATSINTATIGFSVAQTANAMRVTLIG